MKLVVTVQTDTAFSEHITWIWPIWNTTQTKLCYTQKIADFALF